MLEQLPSGVLLMCMTIHHNCVCIVLLVAFPFCCNLWVICCRNYNTSANPASSDFVSAIWSLNDQLAQRGSFVCPSNCACDQLTACGKPYLPPPSPTAGMLLVTAPCVPSNPLQAWSLASGRLGPASDESLCVQEAPQGQTLALTKCPAQPIQWIHAQDSTLALQSKPAAKCLDLNTASGFVEQWACGSAQPNQQVSYASRIPLHHSSTHTYKTQWAFDNSTSFLVSMSNYGSSDQVKSPVIYVCVTASCLYCA